MSTRLGRRRASRCACSLLQWHEWFGGVGGKDCLYQSDPLLHPEYGSIIDFSYVSVWVRAEVGGQCIQQHSTVQSAASKVSSEAIILSNTVKIRILHVKQSSVGALDPTLCRLMCRSMRLPECLIGARHTNTLLYYRRITPE